jgi:hypothetical protein
MDKRTRIITISAALTALTVLFLYLASVFPTGQLAIIAIASLFGVAAVIEAGMRTAVIVFVGCSLLGLLIVPDKPLLLLYILFFGHYPIIKSLFEKAKSRILEWALKLVVFNAALSVIWLFFKSLIFEAKYLGFNTILVYIAANFIFVLYDIGLSRLIGFYIDRISKHLWKK